MKLRAPLSLTTRKGAALVEYGILVGLVAVLAIGAVLALGEEIEGTFGTVEETLSSNLGAASGASDDAGAVAANIVNSYTFTAVTMAGPSVHGVCSDSTGCGTAYGSQPVMSGAGSLVVIGTSHHGGNDQTGVVFQNLPTAPFDMEVSCNGVTLGTWAAGTAADNNVNNTFYHYVDSSTIDPFDAGDAVTCEIRDVS